MDRSAGGFLNLFSCSIRERSRGAVIPPVVEQTVAYLKSKGEPN